MESNVGVLPLLNLPFALPFALLLPEHDKFTVAIVPEPATD
jgi:hypothetical protein